MSSDLLELGELIAAKAGSMVTSTNVTKMGELEFVVLPAGIVAFVDMLKSSRSTKFSTLVDITAIDFPSRPERFEVVYHFLSMYTNTRCRVRMSIKDGDVVPSITEPFPAANWFEREVFDMYGIMFSGHPDLRRILTDYGFRGYPLRKDFPTTGYTELRYDEAQKRVVYEPVTLVQEYRQFDFMSPWEGAEYILPGDDKAEAK
jgi:NADH-quinone oxidoreductase subunit C